MWGFSISQEAAALLAGDPPQRARPTSDIADGSWTDQSAGTTLYAAIDEASPPDDADYVQSAAVTATPDYFEVALGSLTDPAVGTGHTIRYRIGKDPSLAKARVYWAELEVPFAAATVPEILVSRLHPYRNVLIRM